MTFSDRIDAIRNDVPGCRLVAFGDTRTRLVLRASHAPDIRREHLDRLCHEAAACFETADAAGQGDVRADEAMVLTMDDMRIFVRHPDTGSDFLCLVCELACDPGDVIGTGHRALKTLVEVG